MADELLQFAPFESAVDAGFWYQLTKKKLDVYKLDDRPVDIFGYFSNGGSSMLPPIVNIDYSAFDCEPQISASSFVMKGLLLNTNTLEEFKLKDKKVFLQSIGLKVWEAIKDGSVLENPSVLQFLLCLTFADLKKYHYYYWFAFPAMNYPESTVCKGIKKFADFFTAEQINQFSESYAVLSSVNKTAFLVQIDDSKCSVFNLKEYENLKSNGKKILLGFADPSKYEKYPGWPLRNILAMVAYHWGKDQSEWDIVCFREYMKDGQKHFDHSIVVSVHLNIGGLPTTCPDVVGWEKNKSKLAPRKVDMSSSMDPTKLADSAIDLNLKLMRWRLAPNLNLQEIKSSSCLLFGAGTLGCNVARNLMGWGVRKITFVDNSTVSFSNPVRQTLFNFEDCLGGGSKKALAAAKALKRIFPGMEAEGHVISVPMPGHAIPENNIDQVKSDVQQIEKLIESHDVIFLLTDSRESRWLPTLLGAAKQKVVINAALGFDTFLVMRHGARLPNTSGSGDDQFLTVLDGNDLGCYFCNDVMAPGNSLSDRTLDQQCTVTRPGISYIAAGYAVELMVSILQHPKRNRAPTSTLNPSADSPSELATDLGIVPHQIRGYLDRFQNSLLTSKAFSSCTACSQKIIVEYQKSGFDFLIKVFNDSCHLELVTGLADLMADVNEDEVLALSDDEEDF